MTRTHSHTSVHECLQTRSDISTCLYCLHREQEKKERKKEILLEYRAVKVVKNKKNIHPRKIENVRNRHTHRPYAEK